MTFKRRLFVFVLVCFSTAIPVLAQTTDNDTLPTKTVTVGDIDVAYQDFGKGEPLVMIMGYGGSMDLWSPRLLQLLSDQYHVYVFDNRGMGHSTSSPTEYSIPLFAEDTLGLMDVCGIEKAYVLGWSMGAEIAQELAISQPDRVEGLVLIAGSPGGKEQIAPNPEILRQLTDTSGNSLQRGLRLIGLLFPQDWMKIHPTIWSYFPINATMNPSERSMRQLHAMMEWEGSYARLDKIEVPTLVICGNEDVVFAPQNSILLAAGIRNARLVQIPDGGQGVIFQYPDLVADEMASFFKKTEVEGR
ncbi:MAG TPA: alpha/beta hydrolase [Spirochaetia bacterium]|nr:alpha/beta hydrolase [Spirochaetia bacterium]